MSPRVLGSWSTCTRITSKQISNISGDPCFWGERLLYDHVRMKDLPKKWVDELEVFFVNYHNLEGEK